MGVGGNWLMKKTWNLVALSLYGAQGSILESIPGILRNVQIRALKWKNHTENKGLFKIWKTRTKREKEKKFWIEKYKRKKREGLEKRRLSYRFWKMWRGVLIAVLLIVVLGRARCEAEKKVTNIINFILFHKTLLWYIVVSYFIVHDDVLSYGMEKKNFILSFYFNLYVCLWTKSMNNKSTFCMNESICMAQRNTKTAGNITDILLYTYGRSGNSFFILNVLIVLLKKETMFSLRDCAM